MKLNGNTGGDFEVAPEGPTQAVLVDVVDLGMQINRFATGEDDQQVHQMKFVFQTEDETSKGTPYLVQTYPYTASFSTKSNVRKFVEAMLGKKIGRDDLAEDGTFDLDQLIGTNANITVTHTEKGDKTYANITNVTPLGKKQTTRLEPRDYTRVQDREDRAVAAGAGGGEGVPF